MQNPHHRYQSWDEVPEKMTKKKKASRPNPKKRGQRVQPSQSKPKKSISKGMTFAFIGVCLFGLLMSGTVLFFPDLSFKDFGRIKIQFPSLWAADSEISDTLKKKEKIIPTSEMLDSENAKLSMENTSLNEALEKKRQDLEKRERALEKLAENLEEKKIEIDKQLKEMQNIRRDISSKLAEKVDTNQKSLDKLVSVYSNMKPSNAAKILTSINEDLAVKVLGQMKKQNAAAILNYIDPGKARVLSEKYAGLKK